MTISTPAPVAGRYAPDRLPFLGYGLLGRSVGVGRSVADAMIGGRFLYARLEDERALLLVARPDRCDHTARVCWNCVDSWAIDHDIWLGRTPSGRAMAVYLGLSADLGPVGLRTAFAPSQDAAPACVG